jgi:peptidoglycan/xylan/chitin deacetylase (PgdA/CDA1 family)
MDGGITISMEIELGWGVHDLPRSSHLSEDGTAERAHLERLLDHCDDLDIPITFDIVGHLLETHCNGRHDGLHREGWFDNDPGTDAATDPLFYAPEVGPTIEARPTDHELCSHTYSHVPCAEATPETVAWELETTQTQLELLTGDRPKSFVPPRHSRPPADQLREADIEIMRMSVDTSNRGRMSRLRELIVGPQPLFEPAVVDGIVETYCTSYPSLTSPALPAGQRPAPAIFQTVPTRTRQYLQRRYLRQTVDAALATDGHCHLWCHLYDLSNPVQWPVIESFLSELATRRNRGERSERTAPRGSAVGGGG